MIPINPTLIVGNWRAGWALDIHTVSSRPIPGGWDTTRTPVGEALYAFKFKQDRSQLEELAQTVAEFLRTRIVCQQLAAIVPVPPSDEERGFQPVPILCERVSLLTGIRYRPDLVLKQRRTAPLKNIEGSESRAEALHDAFTTQATDMEGRWILLLDDIYRSGETLAAATDALSAQGKVGRVYAVTLTRTRSKR